MMNYQDSSGNTWRLSTNACTDSPIWDKFYSIHIELFILLFGIALLFVIYHLLRKYQIHFIADDLTTQKNKIRELEIRQFDAETERMRTEKDI